MSEISLDEYYDAVVIDSDGEKVGGVGQVFLDEETGEPSWVTVRTGLFGLKESFVPLVDARLEDGRLHVAFPREFIKDAPRLDPEAPMTVAEEDGLQAYYGTEDEPEKIAATLGITVEELEARRAESAPEQEASPTEDESTADEDAPAPDDATPADATSAGRDEADPEPDPAPGSTPDPEPDPDAPEHIERVEHELHVYPHQTDFADEADPELVDEGEKLHDDERFR